MTSLALAALVSWALALALGSRVVAQEDAEVAVRTPADPEHARNLVRAAREGLDHVPGEVIVKFRDGFPSGAEARAVASALSLRREPAVRWIGDAALVLLEEEPDALAAAEALAAEPQVEYAEANYLYRLHARPNDPFYGEQWNLEVLDMERAWAINPGGSSDVVVAVVDTGLAFQTASYRFLYWDGRAFVPVVVPFAEADDLIAPGRVVSPTDFIWGDDKPLDMVGHGTHVAGTIGQLTNNGRGVAGMASNVRIMPLKVCFGPWDVQFWYNGQGVEGWAELDDEGCDTASVAAAVRFAADNGAKVINLSLGGPQPSSALRDAIAYAVQKGVFVAAAMGNEFEEGNPVSYPAAYAGDIGGLVSVGAVGRSLTRASYSNTGPHVELAAPGGDSAPQGCAGLVAQQTLNPSSFAYPPALLRVPRFDVLGYMCQMGTSMATPHVAGAAALLISQGITSPAAVEAALRRFARDLGPAGLDDEYGSGLIQPRDALRGLGLAR
jgi:serine protease